jgi:hypothetical protein
MPCRLEQPSEGRLWAQSELRPVKLPGFPSITDESRRYALSGAMPDTFYMREHPVGPPAAVLVLNPANPGRVHVDPCCCGGLRHLNQEKEQFTIACDTIIDCGYKVLPARDRARQSVYNVSSCGGHEKVSMQGGEQACPCEGEGMLTSLLSVKGRWLFHWQGLCSETNSEPVRWHTQVRQVSTDAGWQSSPRSAHATVGTSGASQKYGRHLPQLVLEALSPS